MTNPYNPSEENSSSKSAHGSDNDAFLSGTFPPEIPDPQQSKPNFNNPYMGETSPSVPPNSTQSGNPYGSAPQGHQSPFATGFQGNGTYPSGAAPMGAASNAQFGGGQNVTSQPPKNWLMAVLLAFFLGGFGAHNFYLGYKTKAIIQLSIAIIGILTSIIVIGGFLILAVGIWAFVEFLMLLINSDSRDAWGRPLVRN